MNEPPRRSTIRSRLYARVAYPPVLLTLLALAFGAGLFIARLPAFSPATPAPALAPLAPTPIPPSPTPPPTPTATSPETGDVLETLYIEIAPPDMATLEAKRQEALRLGILLASDADFVPATIRVGQETIPVNLRLKGDWADHFAREKWSFRIRTRGEHYLFGMRVFNVQDPSTRSFLNEWLFLENLRREGVLAVGYRFVRVVLNGEYKGIYALEEGFARELIESQERRQGLIVCYDEDLVWEYRAYYDDQLIPFGVNAFHVVDEFEAGYVARSPDLSAQRDTAIGLLEAVWRGQRPAAEVFDLETMGRFLALSDLWSAPHGLIWHNLRYYYNPITARLEPVAFDCDALAGNLDLAGLPQSAFPDEPWMQRTVFYDDPQLQAAYVRELARVSQPGYVEALEAELGPQFERLRAALETEFGAEPLAPPWDTLRRRQELARQIVRPLQAVYAYVRRPQEELTTTLDLDVGNLLNLPVEVIGLEMGGALAPANRNWVASESAAQVVRDADTLVLRPLRADADFVPYVYLRVPVSALPGVPVTNALGIPDLRIVTRLWGLTATITTTVLPGYPPPLAEGPLPEPPTLEQALAQHPYLQVAGENMLTIPAGTWAISGSLVLPAGYGLRLGPGTTLRFGETDYLLARGPLDLRGNERAPVVLEPLGERWNGVVVLDAGADSTWEYVTLDRAYAIDRHGWLLTGGATFYRSPIRLSHSRIVNALGEDGINVVRARFEFVDSEFGPAFSDAFDADFAQGRIECCVFHDTGGDAVDVSGSDVQVRDVRLLDIGDKGLSVGEGSRLTAQAVYIENAGFGLASKDLSQATLSDATIAGVRVAGLAAYIKKPQYGPASVTASRVTFVDVPPEQYALVQTGSWIDLDGVRIWGTEVDVEALYQR